ncbi:MAG: hypothetical protein JST12_16440 [Armatimonadetes bacterium]|nr:hypothetical protein [Armatimonadota bacterium]MBS1703254.1 hypothetical protein [Armatimonadota bacterium]
MSVKKKVLRVGCLLVVIALGITWFSPAGKAIRDLVPIFFKKDISGTEAFKGDLEDRLKAMYTAAELYQTSEDAYPEADKWMDELLTRLKTQNLKKGEAEKKIMRPDLQDKDGEYGFAINTAAAGKYKGDIKDPKTILIFESKDTKKNASGDPKTDGLAGGKGITIGGEIVNLE